MARVVKAGTQGDHNRKRGLGAGLVVEDDAILAMSLEHALLQAGASEVVIAASTAEALAVLETLKPAILVLDVHLADRDDGWAIAELVIQLSPIAPQIIFSTGTPELIPPEIAELGTVLVKPYDPERIVEVLAGVPAKAGLLARLRGAISSEE